MTVTELRALARGAVFEAGVQGFVRFLPEGDAALLVTDALRNCAGAEQTDRLIDALAAQGFACEARGSLLVLTPGDALLASLAQGAALPDGWDWDGELAALPALADRWLRAPDAPMGEAGRRLAIETARLIWKPRAQVLQGLDALRARAAVMQRCGDYGGLRLCGGMLAAWHRNLTLPAAEAGGE